MPASVVVPGVRGVEHAFGSIAAEDPDANTRSNEQLFVRTVRGVSVRTPVRFTVEQAFEGSSVAGDDQEHSDGR
jgi:hypothetical protein